MPIAISLALSLAVMPLARYLGLRTGLVDRPGLGALKIHPSPVPILGGPAALAAVIVALAVTADLGVALTVGVCLGVAVGLADDVRSLPAFPRVVVIGLAGAIASGASIHSIDAPVAILLGMLLGIACANGVNLVDGQDALAGGLAVIAALAMAAAGTVLGVPSGPAIGLALSGGLIGFLVWNRPPARIFLGNGGAYGVGLLLSVQASFLVANGSRGLAAAALCLGPFAFEILTTVARRLGSRESIVAGDRRHTYDVLAERRGSRGQATAILWGLGAVCGGLGVLAAALTEPAAVAIASTCAVLALGAGLSLIRRGARGTNVERHTFAAGRRTPPRLDPRGGA